MENLYMDIIEKAINTPRDIQHLEAKKCKCGRTAYISETMLRDRYKVGCVFCHKESAWHSKIDDAVREWNDLVR